MPIIGGLIRQVVILRVAGVLQVATIVQPEAMLKDVVYSETYPIADIQEALQRVFESLLLQEHTN